MVQMYSGNGNLTNPSGHTGLTLQPIQQQLVSSNHYQQTSSFETKVKVTLKLQQKKTKLSFNNFFWRKFETRRRHLVEEKVKTFKNFPTKVETK